jgi:hypothetical protein
MKREKLTAALIVSAFIVGIYVVIEAVMYAFIGSIR